MTIAGEPARSWPSAPATARRAPARGARHQGLPGHHRPRRRHLRRARRQGQRARGRERRRQVDADEDPGGRRAADLRARAHGRRAGRAAQRHGGRAARRRHHLPGAQPLPQPVACWTTCSWPRSSCAAWPSTARPSAQKARELLARLGQDIDPDELVSNLRIGQQQIVEIAKALTHDVRVLIMDEPTSALSAGRGRRACSGSSTTCKARGVSIVYISHKLDELLRIGDRVTVLRDGRIVAHAEAADVDVPWIIEQMVGRSAASLFTRSDTPGGRDPAARRGRDPAAPGWRLPARPRLPRSCTRARSWASTG